MAFTLRENNIREKLPRAIKREFSELNGEPKFVEGELTGQWLRVYPSTAADVKFLQMLEHGVDKFAPAHGGGVLVSAKYITSHS